MVLFPLSTASPSLQQRLYAGSTAPILAPLSLQNAHSDPSQEVYEASVADAEPLVVTQVLLVALELAHTA